tara:strand:+ start:304 stop:519 length:216 start_codon:yes stop_codon:yes gene_type:complete
MRNSPLRAFAKKSPVYKDFDFSKTADYSPEATKGTVGDKIAKAVTPKGLADIVPVGKVVKGAKAVYNYFRG